MPPTVLSFRDIEERGWLEIQSLAESRFFPKPLLCAVRNATLKREILDLGPETIWCNITTTSTHFEIQREGGISGLGSSG